MPEQDQILELAIEIAGQAGELLMNRPSRFQLDEKSGALDFATQMDIESERLIVSAIKAARPNDAILGEEGGDYAGDSGLTWVIDPIDGTVNYLYGIPGWCISIAVKDSDGALAGVVAAPSIGALWSATRGAGAKLNGLPIRCNDPVELNRALVATGFAYDLVKRGPQAQFIATLLPKIRDIRRLGACAVDIAMVASGGVDAHFEAGVNEWDHAAATLIAKEAGAQVSVVNGIWDGQKDFVLVAGPALHRQLAAELESYLGFTLN